MAKATDYRSLRAHAQRQAQRSNTPGQHFTQAAIRQEQAHALESKAGLSLSDEAVELRRQATVRHMQAEEHRGAAHALAAALMDRGGPLSAAAAAAACRYGFISGSSSGSARFAGSRPMFPRRARLWTSGKLFDRARVMASAHRYLEYLAGGKPPSAKRLRTAPSG